MVEINIISRDTIKPSIDSSSLRHLSPFKLSILDQLTSAIYVPLILFYPMSGPKSSTNLPETLARLKSSLSETLTLYYPFSGRVMDNHYVHDFDTGIPFLEAHVNCRMLEFLKLQDIEVLNRLLPFQPLCRETGDASLLPISSFQVSVFACGGIAIGQTGNHKICDGETCNSFLQSWVAIFSGKHDKVVIPNFTQASVVFPPRDLLPKKYLDLANRLWFPNNNNVTRRFVFSVQAIATLQANSRSESVPKPTRTQALTSFIWKHAMAASRALSPAGTSNSSPRTSMMGQAVNLRPRMKQQMPSGNYLGNFFLSAMTIADSSKLKEAQELCDLVKLSNESVKGVDANYIESLQGDDGFGALCEYYDKLELLLSSKPPPDVYFFSSWTSLFNELDFGWGKPCWRGFMGKSSPEYCNSTVFIEAPGGKGIEAWVTLEENHMAMLEKNPNFLAFASPNPGIF